MSLAMGKGTGDLGTRVVSRPPAWLQVLNHRPHSAWERRLPCHTGEDCVIQCHGSCQVLVVPRRLWLGSLPLTSTHSSPVPALGAPEQGVRGVGQTRSKQGRLPLDFCPCVVHRPEEGKRWAAGTERACPQHALQFLGPCAL